VERRLPIAERRALSAAQRLRLTIEASRAALRFANGARHDDRPRDAVDLAEFDELHGPE